MSKSFKEISFLSIGTLISQGISFLSVPVLALYYTPEQYGTYGIILTISGFFITIASFKYEIAILKTNNPLRRVNLVALCTIILGFTSFAFLFGSVFLKLAISSYAVGYFHTIIIFLIIVGVSYFQILNNASIANHKVLPLAYILIVQKVILIASQLFFGTLFIIKDGLSIGYFLGFSISGLLLIVVNKKQVFKKYDVIEIKKELKNNINYIKYITPQNLLNYFSQNIPVLVFTMYYSKETVGLYFFANNVIQLPINSISNSIRQVFLKDASNVKQDIGKLKGIFNRFTKTILIFIIPVFIIYMFTYERIFDIIFDKEWKDAGIFSVYLLVWGLAKLVNPPSIALFHLFDKQKFLLLYDIILTIVRSGILFTAIFLSSINVVIIYSIVSAIFNLSLVVYWRIELGKNE